MWTRHFCKYFITETIISRTSCKTLYNVLSHTHITIWGLRPFTFFGRGMVYVGEGRFMLEREVDVGRGRFILGADLPLFQTRFVIGWENNRDVDITMPLSLKTIGSAGYKDQWNKKFWCVQVNRMLEGGRFMLEGRVHLRGEGTAKRQSLEWSVIFKIWT